MPNTTADTFQNKSYPARINAKAKIRSAPPSRRGTVRSGGPGHLVHLRFDGDQEIGESGDVHQAVRHPHAQRQQQPGKAELVLAAHLPASDRAEPQQAQRNRHRHAAKVTCRVMRPWLRL